MLAYATEYYLNFFVFFFLINSLTIYTLFLCIFASTSICKTYRICSELAGGTVRIVFKFEKIVHENETSTIKRNIRRNTRERRICCFPERDTFAEFRVTTFPSKFRLSHFHSHHSQPQTQLRICDSFSAYAWTSWILRRIYTKK